MEEVCNRSVAAAAATADSASEAAMVNSSYTDKSEIRDTRSGMTRQEDLSGTISVFAVRPKARKPLPSYYMHILQSMIQDMQDIGATYVPPYHHITL
jgi:hypothetical protein